jgi:hypothetical protein
MGCQPCTGLQMALHTSAMPFGRRANFRE